MVHCFCDLIRVVCCLRSTENKTIVYPTSVWSSLLDTFSCCTAISSAASVDRRRHSKKVVSSRDDRNLTHKVLILRLTKFLRNTILY